MYVDADADVYVTMGGVVCVNAGMRVHVVVDTDADVDVNVCVC